jgi:hypothetical protein
MLAGPALLIARVSRGRRARASRRARIEDASHMPIPHRPLESAGQPRLILSAWGCDRRSRRVLKLLALTRAIRTLAASEPEASRAGSACGLPLGRRMQGVESVDLQVLIAEHDVIAGAEFAAPDVHAVDRGAVG